MANNRRRAAYTRRAAVTLLAGAAAGPGQSQTQTGRPVVHFEIGCRDRAKTGKFYGELFGWQIQEAGAASVINTASAGGIQGHITALGHEPQHYTIFYVEVEDVQASLDKAVALGGKVLVPPIKIPTGMFAWFADIDDNTIGLVKSRK
jgi:predicted enzyme related to lactoylglutathione lyase